jgi:hypothetical protein
MLRARKIYEVALKILAYFRQRNLIWLILGGIQSIVGIANAYRQPKRRKSRV